MNTFANDSTSCILGLNITCIPLYISIIIGDISPFFSSPVWSKSYFVKISFAISLASSIVHKG